MSKQKKGLFTYINCIFKKGGIVIKMKIKFVKAIKGTGNKVHNLEKIINGNSSGEINSSNEFPKYADGLIIRFGYRDPNVVSEYYNKLISGEFKDDKYFTKDDGRVYYLVKKLFKGKTDKATLLNISSFFNITNKQIYGDVDGFIDKAKSKSIKTAYNKGSKVGKKNPLKEAAWIVVHSYLIDKFMSENYQNRIIPKKPELVPLWNHYIEMMNDVPELVKKYYYLNENCESIFTIHFKDDNIESKTTGKAEEFDVDTVFEEDNKGLIIDNHPMDDNEPGAVPSSDEVPFEKAVVDTANTIIDKVVDAAKELKEAINNTSDDKKDNNIIDTKFELINIPEKKDKKEIDEKKDSSNEKKEEYPKITVKRPDEPDQNIRINNESSEANVRNLYKFTDLCRKLGYSVIYSNNQYYPMLVQAFVFNRSNSDKDRRYIMIDPCVVYGDTLRIIHISDNHSGIRNGCFVAISQKQLVEKIIKGTFTKEDRKANNDQLPKVLSDYKDKYYFIDRIDLRNLQSITYNKETKRSISFRDWKGFIVNVSNIFKNPDIPVCRFRITNFKDIAHFKLICDDKVQIYYRSNLPNEESQIKAMASKFWISYDADNQDFQYIYGVMSE